MWDKAQVTQADVEKIVERLESESKRIGLKWLSGSVTDTEKDAVTTFLVSIGALCIVIEPEEQVSSQAVTLVFTHDEEEKKADINALGPSQPLESPEVLPQGSHGQRRDAGGNDSDDDAAEPLPWVYDDPNDSQKDKSELCRELTQKHPCPVCHAILSSTWELDLHQLGDCQKLKEAGPKVLNCDMCSVSYLSKKLMITHQTKVHEVPPSVAVEKLPRLAATERQKSPAKQRRSPGNVESPRGKDAKPERKKKLKRIGNNDEERTRRYPSRSRKTKSVLKRKQRGKRVTDQSAHIGFIDHSDKEENQRESAVGKRSLRVKLRDINRKGKSLSSLKNLGALGEKDEEGGEKTANGKDASLHLECDVASTEVTSSKLLTKSTGLQESQSKNQEHPSGQEAPVNDHAPDGIQEKENTVEKEAENKAIEECTSSSNDDGQPKKKGKKPQVCPLCNKSLESYYYLKKHMLQHEKKPEYKCSTCSKTFSLKSSLRSHVLIHKPDRVTYRCALCPKTFVSKYNFEYHTRSHTQKRSKFHCPICGVSLCDKRSVKLHVNNKHTREFSFPCQQCGKVFFNEGNLKRHMYSHGGKNLACDECGKTFTHKSAVHTHKRVVHTQAERCVCELCGASYKTKSTLTQHHLTAHTDTFRFACEKCGKKFKRSTHLNSHLRTHNSVKPYKCEICGKGFRDVHKRQVHLNWHNNVRSFVCEMCGKCFLTKGNLDKHQYTHSQVKPHVCTECGRGFTDLNQLRKHSAKTHHVFQGKPMKLDHQAVPTSCGVSDVSSLLVQRDETKVQHVPAQQGETFIPNPAMYVQSSSQHIAGEAVDQNVAHATSGSESHVNVVTEALLAMMLP